MYPAAPSREPMKSDTERECEAREYDQEQCDREAHRTWLRQNTSILHQQQTRSHKDNHSGEPCHGTEDQKRCYDASYLHLPMAND